MKSINENVAMLAWLGDAAYELQIREHIVRTRKAIPNADAMHREAVRYVRADAQALAMRRILDELPEEEQVLVRRARNKKISAKPKNADPIDYKWATAFEALIGYYMLEGMNDRVTEIAERAAEIIEEECMPKGGKTNE